MKPRLQKFHSSGFNSSGSGVNGHGNYSRTEISDSSRQSSSGTRKLPIKNRLSQGYHKSSLAKRSQESRVGGGGSGRSQHGQEDERSGRIRPHELATGEQRSRDRDVDAEINAINGRGASANVVAHGEMPSDSDPSESGDPGHLQAGDLALSLEDVERLLDLDPNGLHGDASMAYGHIFNNPLFVFQEVKCNEFDSEDYIKVEDNGMGSTGVNSAQTHSVASEIFPQEKL
eukprot:CAMPEP_0115028352 /NCGR_PEP_ID=MMETSP0216-20121206/36222_1 /TAXON_ID=223996 /ORGANISM="Protocruzia adherens, Strain Boccale" /LENGTH=229 /DNA_ID=CAMNT_0002404465 /DNA_START=64 /DNA_END=753 /DNA_ORIENTATION=+